jgi:hypothetical protein
LENGDFRKTAAGTVNVPMGDAPVIFVVKKNGSVLKNLLEWLLAESASDVNGERIVRGMPLLLIDDEADNASINTKDKTDGRTDSDVTVINARIRCLLKGFEKSAYVGYTATPFANIFVDPDARTEQHGGDLFPKDFIVNIRPSGDYVGPTRVFGLDGDPDAGVEASDPLPIVRRVDDFMAFLPQGHKKDFVPTGLPESLRRAIKCFVISCAARRARGQLGKHNSMLVHVTRFIAVQGRVRDLVLEELKGIQRRLEYGDGARTPSILEEFRAEWDSEFVPVFDTIRDVGCKNVSWAQVENELRTVALGIRVFTINGTAKDALEYKDHEQVGLNVIAIGGDKLSRGLTLEGLSISYFLRTSKMYDTLMQMGRWFGYRPGYLDLCRLFTTGTLISWYKHIALAEEELKREFDNMAAAGMTPSDYGLRVRTHPDGMIVTSLNKMLHSRTMFLSWAGTLVQTAQISKKRDVVADNLKATETFVGKLGPEEYRSGNIIWHDIAPETVCAFLRSTNYPAASIKACGPHVADYIEKQAAIGELTNWTVAMVSGNGGRVNVGPFPIKMVVRTPERPDEETQTLFMRKSNILNPQDEAIDFYGQFTAEWLSAIRGKRGLVEDVAWLETTKGILGSKSEDVAKQLTSRWQGMDPPKLRKGASNRANGRVIRLLRRPQNALLIIYPIEPMETVTVDKNVYPTGLEPGVPLIGMALSFPSSERAVEVEYKINKVMQEKIQTEDSLYED